LTKEPWRVSSAPVTGLFPQKALLFKETCNSKGSFVERDLQLQRLFSGKRPATQCLKESSAHICGKISATPKDLLWKETCSAMPQGILCTYVH